MQQLALVAQRRIVVREHEQLLLSGKTRVNEFEPTKAIFLAAFPYVREQRAAAAVQASTETRAAFSEQVCDNFFRRNENSISASR